MLNDTYGFQKVYLAVGSTDLRKGIDGLAGIVKFRFNLNPYDRNTLFLFCGKKPDRIKGLVWEGDGFLLLYKRINIGTFKWPRSEGDAVEITREQYHQLMQGFEVIAKRPILELEQTPKSM